MTVQVREHRAAHWRKNLRITAALLTAWLIITFCVTFFARDLSWVVAGFPVSFWMAAQGTLLVYLALIGVYAWAMGRLDEAHRLTEGD